MFHLLAERLGLDLKRPIKNLSKGNKQKVGVIQALMHRPELLLLDEPTGGLDPLMQQEVLGLIREAKADGGTVFFSSHIMGEVETVAERVAIIRQGRIVEVAETAALVDRGLRHATVRFKEPVDSAVLDRLPGVQVISRDDGLNVAVSYLETARPSLEEVFLAYYEAEQDHEEGV